MSINNSLDKHLTKDDLDIIKPFKAAYVTEVNKKSRKKIIKEAYHAAKKARAEKDDKSLASKDLKSVNPSFGNND